MERTIQFIVGLITLYYNHVNPCEKTSNKELINYIFVWLCTIYIIAGSQAQRYVTAGCVGSIIPKLVYADCAVITLYLNRDRPFFRGGMSSREPD